VTGLRDTARRGGVPREAHPTFPAGSTDPTRPVEEVHLIVPEGIDDPSRPSGGNVYDRRARQELVALGWTVREHAVPGAWPRPGAEGHLALARAVREIPDDAVVLLDGLIASAAPETLVGEAIRLRLVVLVHMPLGDRTDDAEIRARERAVLTAAAAVVTTSDWCRRRLAELYGLRAEAALPGVDPAGLATGTDGGGALLCVAAVTPAKGHDVLLDGLATVAGLAWRCTCAGSLDRDPAHARAMRRRAGARVLFTGPLTGADLARAYAGADLLVHPSRAETYGMVITEALAHGVPVLAADAGGVSEALGGGGLLVPPGDAAALGAALRRWLEDGALRARLRRAAQERRAELRGWDATAAVLAGVLAEAAR
jgi:glycosyltransferase involved in cell wall biosynthesis